jgi:hypothetical protein
MDFAELYAISLGAVFVILIGWHLAAVSIPLRRRLWNVYRQRIMYTNLVARQSGSNDFTLASAVQVLSLISLNVVACAIYVEDSVALSTRVASVALVNLVPLYLGGRTSLLANSLFGLDLPYYIMMHGWLGRICLTEALVHGIVCALKIDWNMSIKHILVTNLQSFGRTVCVLMKV